jgi:hypothetical protein
MVSGTHPDFKTVSALSPTDMVTRRSVFIGICAAAILGHGCAPQKKNDLDGIDLSRSAFPTLLKLVRDEETFLASIFRGVPLSREIVWAARMPDDDRLVPLGKDRRFDKILIQFDDGHRWTISGYNGIANSVDISVKPYRLGNEILMMSKNPDGTWLDNCGNNALRDSLNKNGGFNLITAAGQRTLRYIGDLPEMPSAIRQKSKLPALPKSTLELR